MASASPQLPIDPLLASDVISGLVAYYSFDDSTAVDISSNRNSGTIYGDPKPAPGARDMALQFDGIDDYIEVASSSSLNPTELTVAAWISPDSVSHPTEGADHYMILNKEKQYEFAVFGEAFDDALPGEVAFAFGPRWIWFGGDHFVELGEFVHVAISFDESYKATMYVNGSKTREVQYSGGIAATTHCLRIGARGCSATYGFKPRAFFSGILDEIRIYDRALSQAEVQALYQTVYSAYLPLVLNVPSN